jgi:LCP family protein required for cell wall assembly
MASAMTFRSRKVSPEKSAVAKAAGAAASGAKKTLDSFTRKALSTDAPAPASPADAEKAAERRSRRVRVLARILIVLVAILCIGTVVNLALEGIFGLRMISLQSVMSSVGTPPPVDAYGHTNLPVLGVGDKDHDGVDLTDTIMVVSLDPKDTKTVVMLSIPRDLWLTKIDHAADGRINQLYRDVKSWTKRQNPDLDENALAKLAMVGTADEIGRRLGIEIHGVIKADFTGFVQAVDAIGGVDVDVPEDIIDMEYPDSIHENQFDPFRISKGPQHLDGETALKYARSRHTTSDFGRSARQQQLLSAMAAKVREQGVLKNPGTILTLLKIAGEHVAMTMGSTELIGLADVAMRLDLKHPLTIQLTTNSQAAGGFLYPPPRDQFGGASVLLPEGGKDGWQQVKDLVTLAIQQRLLSKPHQIAVENAGARSGLARNLGFELMRFGFNVVDIRNRPKAEDGSDNDAPHSVVQMPEHDPVGSFLAGLLSLPTEPLPAGALAGTATGAVLDGSGATLEAAEPLPLTQIVLGEDYTFKGVSDLLHPDQ